MRRNQRTPGFRLPLPLPLLLLLLPLPRQPRLHLLRLSLRWLRQVPLLPLLPLLRLHLLRLPVLSLRQHPLAPQPPQVLRVPLCPAGQWRLPAQRHLAGLAGR